MWYNGVSNMANKPKFCPECGAKTNDSFKFCEECGYKLVITEVVQDKEGHIRKAEEVIESESPIKAPKKLTLMPGEKLLERHLDFYVSNKRIIKHIASLLGAKTKDYHYRHIKWMQEDQYRPFLGAGLVIGIISLIIGSIMTSAETGAGLFILIIGIVCIIIAFWYKKIDLLVMHIDGESIRVPNIKSESGKKIANVLRTQLYNR